MATEIVTDFEPGSRLHTDWNELAGVSEFKSPLLKFEWFYEASKAFCSPTDRLFTLIFRDEKGRLQAAAPLQKNGHGTDCRLSIIGSQQLYEPTGFLFRNRQALQELICGITKLGFPLQLNRLPADGSEMPAIKETAGTRGLIFKKPGPASMRLPVDCSWNQYETDLSTRTRSDLRRARRRAEKLGKVEFSIGEAEPARQEQFFRYLVDVEERSWKGRAGSAISSDPRYELFFRLLVNSVNPPVRPFFGFLMLDGRPVAAQLALLDESGLWILKSSFDRAYGCFSPGILLMHEVIHHAFEHGVKSVEFLGTNEPWLEIWTKTARPYSTLNIYNLNIPGLCVISADAIRLATRFVKRKLTMDYWRSRTEPDVTGMECS